MKGFLRATFGGLIDTVGYPTPLGVKGLGAIWNGVRVIRRRGGFKVCPMPCHTLPVPGRLIPRLTNTNLSSTCIR